MHQFTNKKTQNIGTYSYTTNVSSRPTSQISNINIFLPRVKNLRCQSSIEYIGPKIGNSIRLKILLF